MTNREWVNSLSNEDFIKWLLDTTYEKPLPKLESIIRSSTSSEYSLMMWLDEERKER